MNYHDNLKYGGDALSAAVVVGTLAQWLPAAAALLTIIWTAIRIFETRTVQRLLGRPDPLPGESE